jgi:hypothetical protein
MSPSPLPPYLIWHVLELPLNLDPLVFAEFEHQVSGFCHGVCGKGGCVFVKEK